MEYTEEELAQLTDEEREALLEDDGEGEEGTDDADGEGDEADGEGDGADDGEGDADDEGEADDQLGDEGADAGADEGAVDGADDAGADEGAAASSEPVAVPHQAIDFNGQLASIEAELEKIEERYDEGELTSKERRQQMRTLEDQRVELIVLQREAHNAAVREVQERDRVVNTFLAEVGITRDMDDPMFAAFDKCVIKVANTPENATLSAREILEKSHALMRKQFGLGEPAPKPATSTKPAGKTKPKPPVVPSLAKVPASAATATDEGNRFSHLDRLDPVAREEAVGKMSESERDAYLMYG